MHYNPTLARECYESFNIGPFYCFVWDDWDGVAFYEVSCSFGDQDLLRFRLPIDGGFDLDSIKRDCASRLHRKLGNWRNMVYDYEP